MGTTGFLEFLRKKGLISRKKLVCLLIFVSFWASISYWTGGWLIYHKPAFKGRVLDAETKEPIEGAVVVIVYNKHDLLSGPGGGDTSVVKVKETLTDKKGDFNFPPYSTLIQPNSYEWYAEFIIYKRGYDTFPARGTILSGLGLDGIETFFSKPIGSEGELEVMVRGEKGPDFIMAKVKFGIAELPALKTWKEKEQAWMNADIFSDDIRARDLPLLFKEINKERVRPHIRKPTKRTRKIQF